MQRRQFIQSLMAVAATNTFLSGSPLSFKLNSANAAQGKVLVNIFQRGGCDGLNCVVPYTDPRYYQLRPTIAISPPDASDPTAALDIDGQFGFHPALAPLHDIYQTGDMAILPAVHYPNASRSHFASQNFIESGQTVEGTDGWLNRHLQTQSFVSQFRAVGFGDELAQALRGEVTAASLTDINNFSLDINESEQSALIAAIDPVYAQNPGASVTKQLLHRFGVKVNHDLKVIQQIRQQPYTPANGAVYPTRTRFGQELRQLAQLIKAGVGLEVATVTSGGWDHHSNQGGGTGAQATNLGHYSDAIKALYTDLGSMMEDVVIMSQTEFGRSVAENASGGTDHGWASCCHVIGGGVNPGIHGDWPGLAEDQLEQGRFLRQTVDYRDIYAQILSRHLSSTAPDTILPGHQTTDIGLWG